jgi:hypothetical protein
MFDDGLEQFDRPPFASQARSGACAAMRRMKPRLATNKAKYHQPIRRKTIMKNSIKLLALVVALQWGHPASAAGDATSSKKTVVFVCLYGSGKSEVAAAHFNRMARERGLPYTAISRGIEPDPSIPVTVREGLRLDGLAPLDEVPRQLAASEAESAIEVVAFDAVPEELRGVAQVNYWPGFPKASKNYDAARDAILRRLEDLVPALEKAARP